MKIENLVKNGYAEFTTESFLEGLAALRKGARSADHALGAARQAARDEISGKFRHLIYGLPAGASDDDFWSAYFADLKKPEAARRPGDRAAWIAADEALQKALITPEAWQRGLARLLDYQLPRTEESLQRQERLLRLEDGTYSSEWAHIDGVATRIQIEGENLAYRTGGKVWFGWTKTGSSWSFFCGREGGFRPGSTLAKSLTEAGFTI